MNRRTLLRLLGGAAIPASLGLAPDALLAAGRKLGSLGAVPAGPLPPFNAHQRATVATLAEAILPATDTPGATAAGWTSTSPSCSTSGTRPRAGRHS